MLINQLQAANFKGGVLCLGFFDCLHIGHRALIECAAKICQSKNIPLSVFTFTDSPYGYFSKSKRQIYTFLERTRMLSALGVDEVVTLNAADSRNVSAEEFLRIVETSAAPSIIVCGRDYTFGRGGVGNVDTLKNFFSDRVEIIAHDFVMSGGKKVATTTVRELIETGDIEGANMLLKQPFHFSGKVMHGHEVGRSMGFPTANVVFAEGKIVPKRGVYLTRVTACDERYFGITNIGSRPTFGDDEIKAETYIDGYEGDLYGKEITVEVLKRIRDIVKFSGIPELKAQLERDKQFLIEGRKEWIK